MLPSSTKVDPGAEPTAVIFASPSVQPQRWTTSFVARPVGGLQPVTVLSIYIVLLLLLPSRLVLPGVGALGTPANMYLLIALLWYCLSWMSRRLRPAPGTNAPRVAVFFLAVAILLSYIAAARRELHPLELNGADRGLILILALTSVVLLATCIRDYDDLERLLRVFVGCATVVAAIAVAEFFLRRSLTGWIQIPGLSGGPPADLVPRGNFLRPVSTTAQPLELGAVMVLAFPFAIQQAFNSVQPRKLVRWAPVGLIAFGAVTTVSRTAIIGLAVCLLVLVPTWTVRRIQLTVVGVIGGTVAMSAAAPGIVGTIVGLFTSIVDSSDTSIQSREASADKMTALVEQRPWTGRGFGTFLPQLYWYTDNMYALALLEMGVVGVAAILVLYLTCIHCGGAGRRRFVDPRRKETGQSFVAAGCVMLIITATFDTLGFAMVSGLYFLLMGLAGAYLAMSKQERMMSGGTPSWRT